MAQLALHPVSVLYSNPHTGVEIQSGFLQPSLKPVAIKVLTSANFSILNAAIQETLGMAKLTHSAVLQLLDCEVEITPDGLYRARIVTELMETDVDKEMKRRKNEGKWWSEMELMQVLCALVSALTQAQSLEIAHRDIKPQNVFTNRANSSVKLGDFGSSVTNISTRRPDNSINGSLLYLSPQLKYAHAQSLISSSFHLQCDPYKADVYSLGATVLAMARLDAPIELMGLEGLWERTERLLETLEGYRVLAGWLRWMLAVQESDRPDFKELYKHLDMQGYMQLRQTETAVRSVPNPPAPLNTGGQSGYTVRPRVYSNPVSNAFLTVSEASSYASSESCVGCSQPILSQIPAVTLTCTHKFHTKDCFFHYIERQSHHFRSDINLTCPVCGTPNDLSYTLAKVFSPGVFERKRDLSVTEICSQCDSQFQLIPLPCKHKLCPAHINPPYCVYCKQCMSPHRP